MEGLDLLPADKNLIGVNMELVSSDDRESILRQHLHRIRADYNFILIDCPPALDLLTLNALMAADAVLIPIQCEFFALGKGSRALWIPLIEFGNPSDDIRSKSEGHPP